MRYFTIQEAKKAGAFESLQDWNTYLDKMAKEEILPSGMALMLAEIKFPILKNKQIA